MAAASSWTSFIFLGGAIFGDEVRLALVAFVLLVVCRGGGCRSGGSGRWMYAEAAASDGHATAVLWGRSAALLGMGGDLVLRGWPVRRLGRRDLWGRSGWKSGRRPRMFGTTFVVCGRSSRVVRATRRLNRAALWLACGRGMSERRLRSRVCVFVAMLPWVVWSARVRCVCGFSVWFSS